MNIDLLKEISKIEGFNGLQEQIAKAYAQVLKIDEEKASKLISAKFDKHIGMLSDKLQKGVTEENLKNIKSSQDVNIDEYLNEKPVIKG